MASASTITDATSDGNPVSTIDPTTDLRKDDKDDKKEEESASQKLVKSLVEKRVPIAAVVTRNMELLDEILMSERFQKLKIQKSTQNKDKKQPGEKEECITAEKEAKSEVNTSENKEAQADVKSEGSNSKEESKTQETSAGDSSEACSEEKMDVTDPEGDPFPGSSKYPGKEQMELNQAMLTAVSSKQPEMLDKILDTGADIHAFDKWYPVLHTIVDMASEELFDVALKYAKNLNVVGHYGNLLHSAVRTGSVKLVKKIYDLSVNEFIKCDGNGASVLHEAVRNVPYVHKDIQTNASQENESKESNGNKEGSGEESASNKTVVTGGEVSYDLSIIEFLLEKGCPINDEDLQCKTPLIETAMFGNRTVAQILIKAGANLSHLDKSNQTPWLYSAIYCHPSMWDDLLDKENLNKPIFRNGECLMHIVCKNKLDDALKFLLSNGADPLVTASNNETPLITAINAQAAKCITILLNHSECGINRTFDDWTPFKRLMFQFDSFDKDEKYELLKLFLEKGVDINAEYPNGDSPLIYHMANGDLEVIKALLDNGADPNYIKKDGNYPLFVVCDMEEHLRVPILKLLLEHNADVTLTNQCVSGFTPLQISMDILDVELTKLFLLAGYSLHLVHDWLRIEQEKVEELNENGYEAILKYVKNKTHDPMSLKGLSRIKVLHHVGVKDKENRIKGLGLPKIMEDYLDWKKYIKMREFEFLAFMDQLGGPDDD